MTERKYFFEVTGILFWILIIPLIITTATLYGEPDMSVVKFWFLFGLLLVGELASIDLAEKIKNGK